MIRFKIATSQQAYYKGRSTDTALNTSVTEIERSIINNEYKLGMFLDIEGSCNNVLPMAIASVPTDFRIPKTLVNLIKQMLLGISQMRKQPSRRRIVSLLWVVKMNKLLKSFEERRTCVVAYADDVTLAVRGKFPNTLCEIMQSLLSEVDKRSTSCGLGVNATKTELVLFTKKHHLCENEIEAAA